MLDKITVLYIKIPIFHSIFLRLGPLFSQIISRNSHMHYSHCCCQLYYHSNSLIYSHIFLTNKSYKFLPFIKQSKASFTCKSARAEVSQKISLFSSAKLLASSDKTSLLSSLLLIKSSLLPINMIMQSGSAYCLSSRSHFWAFAKLFLLVMSQTSKAPTALR